MHTNSYTGFVKKNSIKYVYIRTYISANNTSCYSHLQL